jgi:hypothetical protein
MEGTLANWEAVAGGIALALRQQRNERAANTEQLAGKLRVR